MTSKSNRDLFFDRYFEALGLDPRTDRQQTEKKIGAALSRAHDIRKFEIELYWKRATYFWAFQAVAFAALGFLFKDGTIHNSKLIAVPAMIGAITAFAGFLTARGSKFWQENWEAHVDLLEPEVEGRLTQVIIKRRQPFSVTRVNEWLLGSLSTGWIVALALAAYPRAVDLSSELLIWMPLITVMLIIGAMFCCTRTRLTGRIYRYGDSNWSDCPPNQRKVNASIFWRDAAGLRLVTQAERTQGGIVKNSKD